MRDRIIRRFHRSNRPLYLGEISIEIGRSLETTEKIIDDLVHEGIIRLANCVELKEFGADFGAAIYVLVDRRDLRQAYEELFCLKIYYFTVEFTILNEYPRNKTCPKKEN